jgi:2-amino-4-hydroxy-6-hydroxymethyldihydropteridine diphosphokinase
MAFCLIGLGSNLGDRRATLEEALSRLQQTASFRLIAKSPWYETTAAGGPTNQPVFWNGAVLLETSLAPLAVLAALQRLETELGRRREERWGPRTIDLDLLLYDQAVVATGSLVLPHPRMAWRRFVLQPAATVAGSMLHPTTGWTIARLLANLEEGLPYVAITGSIGAGKTELAQRLTQHRGAQLLAEPLDLERLEAFYADPAGQAWQMELEFLDTRARLLAADAPGGSSDQPHGTVSDFWFDQSLAFARVWLAAPQFSAFRPRWQEARRRVVRPKLIVLLEATGEQLLDRVQRRGRRGEGRLNARQLAELAQAILAETQRPDQGPLLRVNSEDPQATWAEVSAAVEAMEGTVTLV